MSHHPREEGGGDRVQGQGDPCLSPHCISTWPTRFWGSPLFSNAGDLVKDRRTSGCEGTFWAPESHAIILGRKVRANDADRPPQATLRSAVGQAQNLEPCATAQFPGPWQAPGQGCPLSFKERCPSSLKSPWWFRPGLACTQPVRAACPGLTAALPSWLGPQPCHSGGGARRPHSFPGPPCPVPARGGSSVAKEARRACRGLNGLLVGHPGAAPWHPANRNGSTSHHVRHG